MWRLIRIVLLLLLLSFVALETYLTRIRSTSWERTLQVSVYPINADGSDAAGQFIAARRLKDFSEIERFFAEEAREYGVTLQRPLELSWASTLRELPPMPKPDASRLSVILWSLQMRFWAWRAPTPPR